MKILRLSNSIVRPAIADRYIDPASGVIHFNLRHGSKGKGSWLWYAGLSSTHFNSKEDSISLDDDNYGLVEVYSKGILLKDKRDNICYNVIIDNDPSHANDILLLWTITGTGYSDVSYEYSGCADLVGMGISSRLLRPEDGKVDAPILNIYGDCSMRWNATNSSGTKISQDINYVFCDNEWNIGPIKTEDSDDV
jgi:hypothetical protein